MAKSYAGSLRAITAMAISSKISRIVMMQIVLLIEITKHISAKNDGYSITFNEIKLKSLKYIK
jgi:hypothetical protein